MSSLSTAEVKKSVSKEALRFASFAITGGIAAVCNLGSRILFSRVMRYEIAVAFAYFVGMVVAFVLARSFVFEKNQTGWHIQLGRFLIVNMFGFVQVWIVSIGLVRMLFPWLGFRWHPEDVAHLLGVASPITMSYYAHKHFSFRSVAEKHSMVAK
jgi:putative flippase GtrA